MDSSLSLDQAELGLDRGFGSVSSGSTEGRAEEADEVVISGKQVVGQMVGG